VSNFAEDADDAEMLGDQPFEEGSGDRHSRRNSYEPSSKFDETDDEDFSGSGDNFNGGVEPGKKHHGWCNLSVFHLYSAPFSCYFDSIFETQHLVCS
jgi:hypothetical protein